MRAGEGGRELVCAPSRVGCISSWLVAGPMPFLRGEAFDTDFLKGVGGEAAVRPRDAATAHPASGAAWQATVFPDNVLSFKGRCLPLGESAFYLSAVLVPQQDIRCTLVITHTGWARAWVDGKRVVRSDYDAYAFSGQTAEHQLALRKGQRVRLLIKLGSHSRHLQFLVRLLKGRREVGPHEVLLALPLREGAVGAVEPFVLSALQLNVGRDELVEPGKETAVRLGVLGGYPVCEGKLGATITIKDAKGLKVRTLSMAPAEVKALAARSAAMPWTPPQGRGSPYYDLTAQVTFRERELGALTKTVYSPRDIGEWMKAIHGRLTALSAERKVSAEGLAHVLLKLDKALLLQSSTQVLPYSPEDIFRELKTADELLGRLSRGRGLPGLEPGVHELAYLAPQDESAQPYYLHIPRTYTGREPAPAIVYLHGYAPWLDQTNWHELSYGLTDQAEARGYVVICPFARSNTDFQAIGEVDVLHVLRLAQQKLKLDPNRIFLLGYSMGGMGAYTIAAHYPDLWAGVVVMCGRADYYLWKGFDPAKLEPWKRWLLDLEFGWPLAPNFLHVPVLAFQGTADMLIKPEQAYRFVDLLNGLGAKAQLVRLDGQSHWIADEVFSTPRAFDWMDRQRRPAAPKTVRHKTYSLRYNRAYWVTIDAFAQWGRPATVEATLEPGNRLTLRTDNVARLTLRPPKELCDPGAALQATVNGQARALRVTDGQLSIGLAGLPEGKLRKTPALCGPIKEAFNDRFLFVYGTAGSEEETKANRGHARTMQRDWYRFAKALRRVVKDTDVTDKEMARTHLFLFGTPKTHAILARVADQLPIRFTDRGYEVLGRPFPANETTGLMFIYPNPLAPERYIVVCSGAPYGGALPVNHKYDLLPDFILYRAVAQRDRWGEEAGVGLEPDYDDTNPFYCAGFFDMAWQLQPQLIWTGEGKRQPAPAAGLAPLPPLPKDKPAPAVP